MIWLKMTLKCIVNMKTRLFYNQKDPPFDMKHQVKSADPFLVIKIGKKYKSYFISFFHLFLLTLRFVCKTFFSLCFSLEIKYLKLWNMQWSFFGIVGATFVNFLHFWWNCRKIDKIEKLGLFSIFWPKNGSIALAMEEYKYFCLFKFT